MFSYEPSSRPVPAAHAGAASNAGAQGHTTVLFCAIGGGKVSEEGGD